MIVNNPTPSELLVPETSNGSIRRRLCIRNPIWSNVVVMKLRVSPKNDFAIKLSHEFLRLKPAEFVRVEVDIDVTKLKYMKTVEHQICGFVINCPPTRLETNRWLLTENLEMKSQQAFRLNVRLSAGFCSFDTIIDLPGNALMGFKQDGLYFPADAEACTVREMESQINLVEGLKSGQQAQEPNNWLAAAATKEYGKINQAVSMWAWGPVQPADPEQKQPPRSHYLAPQMSVPEEPVEEFQDEISTI